MRTLEEMVAYVLASPKTPALYDEMIAWTATASFDEGCALIQMAYYTNDVNLWQVTNAATRAREHGNPFVERGRNLFLTGSVTERNEAVQRAEALIRAVVVRIGLFPNEAALPPPRPLITEP